MSSRPSQFAMSEPGAVRLYSTTELISFPPPRYLIKPIMTEGGLTALYAPPESLKSFVAIDMALSIAAGIPWQGFPVIKGFVVYVSAEGGAGIGKRVKAWLQTKGLKPTDVDIAWLIESLTVTPESDQMDTLITRLRDEIERAPTMIVVDTLARCFDGDENQQEDMNRFVAGIDLLRTEFRCAVLVVHHTRLDGDRERGNTAFRGAADTMIALKRSDDLVEVACAKQKDDAHFDTFALEKMVVVVGQDEEGQDVSSCVLQRSQIQNQRAGKIMMIIAVLASLGPSKWDNWVEATGISKSDFMKLFPIIKKSGQAVRNAQGLWEARAKVPPSSEGSEPPVSSGPTSPRS